MMQHDDRQMLLMLGISDADPVSLPSISQVKDIFGGGTLQSLLSV